MNTKVLISKYFALLAKIYDLAKWLFAHPVSHLSFQSYSHKLKNKFMKLKHLANSLDKKQVKFIQISQKTELVEVVNYLEPQISRFNVLITEPIINSLNRILKISCYLYLMIVLKK